MRLDLQTPILCQPPPPSCITVCRGCRDVYVVPKHRIVGVDIVQTGCCMGCCSYLFPCCSKQHAYVHFKLKKPKDAWIEPGMYVKMRGLADANVMFDYAYGALQYEGMKDKAQVLAHLLEDDLVERGGFSTLTPSAENMRRA